MYFGGMEREERTVLESPLNEEGTIFLGTLYLHLLRLEGPFCRDLRLISQKKQQSWRSIGRRKKVIYLVFESWFESI